ncbi:hypothetical protein ISCGN_013304 [Ixodes scapularis]
MRANCASFSSCSPLLLDETPAEIEPPRSRSYRHRAGALGWCWISPGCSSRTKVDAHRQLLPAGVRDTLEQLRNQYWILRGRELVKKVIRACVTCQRFSATLANITTALLPEAWASRADPFEVIGTDFAGPLYVKGKDLTCKSYVVLFTCAVTRAVHLELVSGLSTRSFLFAFRRFVSRRGLCRVIYFDNPLTFKRASKELTELWKTLLHPDVVNSGIQWRFIVERAPWWEGFYERLVGSVMFLLLSCTESRTLGSHPDGTIKSSGRSEDSFIYGASLHLGCRHVPNLGEVPLGTASAATALQSLPIKTKPDRTNASGLGTRRLDSMAKPPILFYQRLSATFFIIVASLYCFSL